MFRHCLSDAPRSFIWVIAATAAAFALVGVLITAGAGSTPVGQIMAVLVGFLILGAAGVLALACPRSPAAQQDPTDDWPW